VRILGGPQQLESIVDEFAIHGVGIERVVVAGETDVLSHEALREVRRICQGRQIELSFLPRMLGVTEWVEPKLSVVAPTPVSLPVPVVLPPFFWFKRLIDIVGSLTMIIVLLPIFAAGALLSLMDVGPPIFFWQERLGRHGRSFLIYKFRTLRSPFGSDGVPIAENRRLSAIGRFLRATRIDELPQLLNVLIGDMSLIGPRPLLPVDQPANTTIRLSVRPGITGWAQVNGGKLVGRELKQELDEWYVRHASFWTDLRIVLLTFKLVFRSTSSEEAVADAEQVHGRNALSLQTLTPRREARGSAQVIGAKRLSRQF
jgi:lipopolysaccharide/colanic/teichoic acid biosynthesis glycosyltransferase